MAPSPGSPPADCRCIPRIAAQPWTRCTRAPKPKSSRFPEVGSEHANFRSIIAIHGLGANVDWSWTWKDPKTPGRLVKWLQDPDMLPTVVPRSRILLYNYDSRWHADAPKIRLTLCGEELIRSIRDFREGDTASRPIVFVGHSLGGNVIQHALLYANSDDAFRHITTLTAGVVFLGSPLRGSEFQSLANIVAWFSRFAGSHDGIVRNLAYDNESLMDTLHQFCRMRNMLSIATSCFFEKYETDYLKKMLGVGGPGRGRVVDEASACIPGLERIPLAANHSELNKYSGPNDRSFQSVSAELRRLCEDASAAVQRRTKHALKEKPEARECLRDLFLTDPYEDMMALKRKKGSRAQGTCAWILGTDELTAWLANAPESTLPRTDVLWLHGYPGTGKSTMSMFLAEALLETFSKTPNKTLAYFFCDSGYDTRKTAISLVRGLLLQLVQQHPRLIEHVLPKYVERGTRAFDSFDAVWAMFMKACADTATGRKYCIVDALDECAQDEQITLLKQIKQTFGRDRSGGKLNVSFLITSRPYSEISEHLDTFPNENLASFEDSRRDINKFIIEKVAELKEMKHYTDTVAAAVTRVLREKAGGIFLWVGLACQELEKVASRNAVTRLEKIPAGLQSLYQQLLDTALQQDEDPETIKRLLSFVMVARRPLSTRELASACDLYQDEGEEERIQFTAEAIASCRLMIVVQDDKVQLLHQSVRDFLVSGVGSSSSISESEAHNELASRCVDCLIAKSMYPKRGGLAKEDSDLALYGTEFWPEHAHMAKTYRDSRQTTPLEQCAESGHIVVLEAMLDRADVVSPIDVAVVKAAAGNYQNGEQVMALLLDRRGDQITITEEVVKAAAGNRWNGEQVMRLLLDRRGDQITITKEVVKAAAGNYENGERVMRLLLDRRGDQITITKEVVYTITRTFSKEVMALLLGRRGDQITITEEVVKAAAGNEENGEQVMTLLLDRRGDQITITKEVVKAAAGNWRNGEQVMRLLLDRRGDQITITKEVVKAAAGNLMNGEQVMRLLLDRRGDQITITEEVVKAAAGNEENGERVMTLLLDRRGDQITVTEEVVEAAARNERHGEQVMRLLLDRRGDQITITEEVVKAVVGNEGNGEQVMTLLFDRRGDQITITEEVVKAAVGNSGNGERLMTLLLDRRGDQITITEEVVKAAARNRGNSEEVMALLLDRRGDQITITEEVVEAAARNERHGEQVMTLLLDQRGDQITITKEVVKAAAGNERNGEQVMRLLLDRRGDQITITEEVVKVAAGNRGNGEQLMTLLLDRRGDQITITKEVVKAAAGNWRNGEQVMRLLLDRRGDQITITKEVVKAAAGNLMNGEQVMRLLLDRRGDQITITKEVVKAAAGNWMNGEQVMRLLLDRRGDQITITEEVVKVAAGNWRNGEQVMRLLLDRRGDQITITKEV
ncbi:ankyrin domain protein, partial [Colletotrichum plurivorum]